ncbi:uncharacterized protein LOC123351611 [Mauremys mutica]|uniref:uncharacterized protein LOC123351611 n=1 Tax=Mauremys mutica TaxID=74926 RepID=UPI001D169C0D|nr:uncharacterized protein LOC123351611 [Mauremys mutica]
MVPNPWRWSLLEPLDQAWNLAPSCQLPASYAPQPLCTAWLTAHPCCVTGSRAPPSLWGAPLNPPAWCPSSRQQPAPPQLRFFAALMPRMMACCYHALKTLSPGSLSPQLRSTPRKAQVSAHASRPSAMNPNSLQSRAPPVPRARAPLGPAALPGSWAGRDRALDVTGSVQTWQQRLPAPGLARDWLTHPTCGESGLLVQKPHSAAHPAPLTLTCGEPSEQQPPLRRAWWFSALSGYPWLSPAAGNGLSPPLATSWGQQSHVCNLSSCSGPISPSHRGAGLIPGGGGDPSPAPPALPRRVNVTQDGCSWSQGSLEPSLQAQAQAALLRPSCVWCQ